MEKRVRFDSEGQRIIGILHIPEKKNPPAILMVHGFRVDKDENYGHFLKAANEFCSNGFLVLRFDCRGFGESDGKTEDTTIISEVSDVLAALNFLKKQNIDQKRIGILGKSLGGEVAILAAVESKPKALVLWAPVTDSNRYVNSLTSQQKEELASKGWITTVSKLTGKKFKIGRDFYESSSKIDLDSEIKSIDFPTLIIHGDEDDRVPLNQSKSACMLMQCEKKLEIIHGMDHTFQGFEDKAIELSLKWFQRHL